MHEGVYASLPLAAGLPYTEDWALVVITDRSFIPGCNHFYLGEKMKGSDMRARMQPNRCNLNSFRMPPNKLLSIRGIIDTEVLANPQALDANGEPSLMVVKRGRGTGITIGRTNGILSVTRRALPGVEVESRELLIIGESKGEAFSAPGDAGSILIDGVGRAGALVTSGDARGGQAADRTYATPMWWLMQRIKLYTDRSSHIL